MYVYCVLVSLFVFTLLRGHFVGCVLLVEFCLFDLRGVVGLIKFI